MKLKIEKKLDEEFKKFGVKPRVYHFTKNVEPFNAITVADIQNLSWKDMFSMIDSCIWIAKFSLFNRATRLLIEAKDKYAIYGMAICDKRDQFNRERGRVIAKGRLLKYLKEEYERENQIFRKIIKNNLKN